jgi:hypothetical protein
MPRGRAYRRNQRRIKLARRYRIIEELMGAAAPPDPRQRHWHLNCSCFDDEPRRLQPQARGACPASVRGAS